MAQPVIADAFSQMVITACECASAGVVAVETAGLVGYKALEGQNSSAAKAAKVALVVIATVAALASIPILGVSTAVLFEVMFPIAAESTAMLTYKLVSILAAGISIPIHWKAFQWAGLLSRENAQG